MNRTAVLGVGILASLLALAVGLGIESLFNVVWAQVVVLVVVEVVLLVLAVVIRPEKQLPFLCDPGVLFVAFQSQFFVAGPLLLPFTEFYASTPIPARIVALTVLGFIALLLMFLLGYHMPFWAAIAQKLPDFRGGRTRAPGRWIERVLLIGCLAGCAGFVAYQGGLTAMLSHGYGGGERGGAAFTAVFLLLVLTTFLMAWRIFGTERPQRRDVVLLAALLVFEVAYFGFLIGTRKWLFHLFFGLSAVFLLRRGTRALPRFLLPTLIMLLILYLSFWGTVRGRPLASFFEEYTDARYADMRSLHAGYAESVAAPFGTACLTLQIFPDMAPYRYGSTFLVILLSPIPRAIWPDKPIGLGKELTWYLGGYFATFYDPTSGMSITPTLVGEFYANLGIVGILLGGFVLGSLSRVIAAYSVQDMKDGLQTQAARVLIPAVFIAGLVELRADSAMLTLFYMYTLLPLLALLTFFSFDPVDAHERA